MYSCLFLAYFPCVLALLLEAQCASSIRPQNILIRTIQAKKNVRVEFSHIPIYLEIQLLSNGRNNMQEISKNVNEMEFAPIV